jgi:hypothetical protein
VEKFGCHTLIPELLCKLLTKFASQAVYHPCMVWMLLFNEVNDVGQHVLLLLWLDKILEIRSVKRLSKESVIPKLQLVHDIFSSTLVCRRGQGNYRNGWIILAKLAQPLILITGFNKTVL